MDNKRSIKRILALVLALMMLVPNISVVGSHAAETTSESVGTFKVSVSDGAMVKGDTKQIKVNSKNIKVKSYKSSNKKVLKVNSKGKLKALKKGTATITVTAKDGSTGTITLKVFDKKADMVVDRKIKGKKGLWHIKKGKVVKKTGFATDGISWFYVKKGKVNKKTGIFKGKVNGETAQWYVKKGKVQFDSTDYVFYKGYTYKVVDGKAIDKAKGKVDAFFGDEVCLKKGDTKVIGDEKISFAFNSIYPSGNLGCTFVNDGNELEVTVITEESSAYLLYDRYIKDYKLELIKYDSEKIYIKITKRSADDIKKPMAISGKASDHYTTTDYEYVESENIIMFLPKGFTFDGNILNAYEDQMKSVEKNAGLKRKWHEASYSGFQNTQNYIYGSEAANVFDGVDYEFKKLHIYINNMHPCCTADREYYNYIIMDQNALDINNPESVESTFMHEYTHFVHLTNGPSFNPILNEGFASYIEMKTLREYTDVSEEYFHDNYYYSYLVDEGDLTEENAEKIFIDGYPDGPEHTKEYSYGCILMEYLHQTYGSDTFIKLFDEGDVLLKEQLKNSIWSDLSGENSAKLLKKVYSDNIFKDFVKWIGEHPEYTRPAQIYE